MHPKKLPNSVSESTHITNRKAGTADPLSRAAFTSAIVAALKDLENRRPPVANDLCQRAYQKLQYDLPLVSPEELEGLTDTLRASLQLKSGQPLFPITSKLLENVVAGARAPVTAGPPSSSTQSQSSTSAAGSSAAGNSSSTAGTEAGAADAAPPAGTTTAAASANDASGRNGGTAPQPSLAASTSESVFPCLVDVSLVRPDQQRLCRAFRALCAVIFVQLVSHSLAVSEQDTWALLYATRSDQDENKDESEGPGNPEVFLRDGTADGAAQGTASSSFADKEPTQTAELSARLGGAVATTASNADTPSPDHHNQQQQESSPHFVSGGKVFAPGCSRQDAAYRPGTLTSLTSGCSERALEGIQESIEDGSLRQRTKELRSCILYEECQAADEDGDDFVFEDLEVPSVTAPAASNGNLSHATESPPTPPPYSWPALRARLVWLSGQVSYALLDEPDLWRDGELLQGVFQLLRALGAHRYAQELQPLLHAYVGLVADRIATEPSELSCLDNLWDAVGLQCVASLPQVARHRAAAGSARGGGGVERGQGLLLAEATTCLSLVATLAGQLTGASAKLRLWQQVHKHMLPLLERCLGELARTVGPNTKQAVAAKASAHLTQQQQLKGPGAEEVAAIVLVCQVLDFYVQQRPGNADLAASLKGTGVLASLSVLFAAVGSLPGAEPLRSAALCCAASSKELHAWMLAVPGVDKTLAAPPFQEGGAHEAHGAVWELLGNNGSSSLALSILAGGAATEKAVRVHALLQLLAKAAACRGGRGPGCSGLWSPAVERSMRDLFVSLRQEQAGGVAAVSRRLVSEDVGHGRGAAAAGRGLSTATEAQNQTAAVGPDSNQDEGVNEEDDENEEEKLHLLDPTALQRRRARQLHPACWRILKQLLTVSVECSSKTD
ncbi:hypothetical protein Vretifemale_5521 [Volvox reticuliferus]|uniref:Uncharacterized protein n=3 Tax=Volvox reticuliferus TaxID=1737510 RepID=A0A8J4C9E9_9CHLO|nr:hypothetical protein Vretifemale_5521 [Volvox reticuliferus]